MNLMQWDFPEVMRTLFAMSLTGSMAALFLVLIKPMIKERLPKSVQYDLWVLVVLVLILPLSKIDVLPETSVTGSTSFTPVYDVTQWISRMAFEKPVQLGVLSQASGGYGILQAGDLQNTSAERAQASGGTGILQAQYLNVADIIFIIWQTGMLVFLGVHITGYMRFVQRLKRHRVCADAHETELLRQLSGMKKIPRLCKSSVAATPMLIGLFHPVIVLPDKNYTDEQLGNIFLHELTHFRRHDIVIKWVSVWMQALHWYHPASFFVQREVSRACELACDEAVIRNMDTDEKQNYGDTLIVVAAEKTAKVPLSTAMGNEKKILKERLGAIMKYKKFSRKTMVLSGILLAMVLCGTFYFSAAGRADSTANEGVVASADETPFERQKHEKELELNKLVCDFDKKNIVKTWIYLGDSDQKFTNASLFIVSNEEITDEEQKDALLSLVSENLNIDSKNIDISYMDVDTFTSLGEEGQ